jgi:Uma2 family endonuclease
LASVVVAIEHILTDGGGNFAPWGFVWFHEVGWSRYDGDDRVSKGDRMTFTQVKFASFETYLAAEPWDLPEGHCEYWDGELIPVTSESLGNNAIANFIFVALMAIGLSFKLIRPGAVEVAVTGRPRTRFPDLTVLEDIHLILLRRRSTITFDMPPPKMVLEVVLLGDENSDNYRRDYQDKLFQYADREIPEYWIVDPDRSWVMVGVLRAGDYLFETFRGDDVVISPAFPELTVTVTQILEAGQ